MIARLASLAATLSRREQILLGLMAGVALPAGLAVGALLPLQEQRQAAEQSVDDSMALYQWVLDRSAEANLLTTETTDEPLKAYEPVGMSGLEDGLRRAKLWSSLTELGAETQNGVLLRFDDVDFIRLATWLTSSHPEWGYTIKSYQFQAKDAPSRVSARIELQTPVQ